MMVSMIFLIDLVILLAIARSFWLKQSDEMRLIFWPALAVKLLAGLAVGWIYFYYYGQGDTITYWHDGRLIADKILSDPLRALNFYWNDEAFEFDSLISIRPRSLFFVKITGLIAFLSGGSYWMMALIISFCSFLGAWYLCVKTISFFPGARMAAILAFLFYPSVVFWSSGLIKESLGLGALYFLSGILLMFINHRKVDGWEWVVALVSLWIGWNLKYYWMGVFIPIAITTVLVIMISSFKPAYKRFDLPIWTGLFILLLLGATSIHPNFYPNRILRVIWENNQEFMALTSSSNAIHYHDLSPSFNSVLLNMPQALASGIFRPFTWEAHNATSMVAGIENLLLAILALMAVPSLPKLFRSPNRILVVAIITYILILATFLALSTPNLGTLSRYKVGFLPFLVYLLLSHNPWLTKLMNRNAVISPQRGGD